MKFKLRYLIWPMVRVRLKFWWWTIRYGGKKNIPKRVIFQALADSMKRTVDNFKKAQMAMPDDVPEEERLQMREARMKLADLDAQIKDLDEDS